MLLVIPTILATLAAVSAHPHVPPHSHHHAHYHERRTGPGNLAAPSGMTDETGNGSSVYNGTEIANLTATEVSVEPSCPINTFTNAVF